MKDGIPEVRLRMDRGRRATPEITPSAPAPGGPSPGGRSSAAPNVDPERLSLVLIAGACSAMLALSWQKWAHPLIDFGRELYLPWRLFEGDLLYRDVAHFYAPLSAYVNLGWFAVFGVSFQSLVIGNALVLITTLFLLFRLLRHISDLAATTAALLTVVIVFAFGKYAWIGDFGYLTPYSHELTHGTALSLMALCALRRYLVSPGKKAIFACGFAVGLVFLTKYEVFFAVAGAVGLGLTAFWRGNRRLPSLSHGLTLILALCAPFLLCGMVLSTYLPVRTAFRSALGAFPFLLKSELATSSYYLGTTGLDRMGTFFLGLLSWSVFYVASTLPAAFLGLGASRLDPRVYGAAALVLPWSVALAGGPLLVWSRAPFPLSAFLATSFAVSWWFVLRRNQAPNPVVVLRLTLSAFSLLLLLKVAFNPVLSHYALVLAMPGTALAVVTALHSIPKWLDSRGLNGRLFRTAAGSLVAVVVAAHLATAVQVYARRTHVVGEGRDAFRADSLGDSVARSLDVVRARVLPHQTLVVLPEGAMVNYLSRRPSPVPYINFDPASLSLYGEDAILAQLNAHPPDYVLAFSRETLSVRVLGCRVFGEDCGTEIGSWLRKGYSARVIGVSKGRRMFTLLAPIPSSSPIPAPEVVEVAYPR